MTVRRTVLVVATKAPWPPVDGGRVVLGHTLQGLAELGHRVTLVAPVAPAALAATAQHLAPVCRPDLVAASPRGAAAAALQGLLLRRPLTVRRHEVGAVRARVAARLAAGDWDVVLCEQPQALAAAAPALAAGLPVVVRAHNVESRLWRYQAAHARGVRAALLRAEARRVAAWERRALRRVAAVAAISRLDLAELHEAVGGRSVVELVPAPFPARLEPGSTPLAGAPAVVVLASRWAPAQAATRELVRGWWPAVVRTLPAARLYVFGPTDAAIDAPSVTWSPPPEDSAAAFPAGAVALVPARHPTGVPVKGLEAWARGLPVVAAADAAAALDATAGRELLVASDGDGLAAALVRVTASPGLADALAAAARQRLETHHRPEAVAGRLVELGFSSGSARAAGL